MERCSSVIRVQGYGLLITEDNTCYEGEFSGGLVLYGKVSMTLHVLHATHSLVFEHFLS